MECGHVNISELEGTINLQRSLIFYFGGNDTCGSCEIYSSE